MQEEKAVPDLPGCCHLPTPDHVPDSRYLSRSFLLRVYQRVQGLPAHRGLPKLHGLVCAGLLRRHFGGGYRLHIDCWLPFQYTVRLHPVPNHLTQA